METTNHHSGLLAAAIICKLHGNPLDPEQLRNRFASTKQSLTPLQLARICGELGVKAKVIRKDLGAVEPAHFPLIALLNDGQFAVVARLDAQGRTALFHDSDGSRGQWLDIALLGERLSGTLVLIRPSGDMAATRTPFGFSWFLGAAGKYRAILRDCLLASLFVQVFALFSPLVFMIVIDKVLGNNSLSTLDVLVLALIVVSFFEILLNALRTYLLSHTAHRIDLTLGIRVFKHLLTLPLAYFENRRVGDTIARLRELEGVRQFITGSGLMLLLDLLFLVVFLLVMLLFSPFLTGLVALTLPLLFLSSFVLSPILRDRLEDRYTTNAENHSFLVETLSGMATIKATAAEARIQEKWEEKLTHHVKNAFAGGNYANLIGQITAIVSKCLSVLLLWFGAREVLHGNLTVGQLIAFNMISARVVAPILRLSSIWKEFQQTRISVSRLADIFDCPAEPGFSPRKVALPDIAGRVVFDRVFFRYHPQGHEVLSEVSFTVEPGEVVGIVGSTGSGKTTVAKLLQRLYVPERGRILIDGIDLAGVDGTWLRRQLGVVVQDGMLFNATIRDNITLNAPHLELDEVIAAARLTGAHDFILELPQGYDTPVGERGIALSTGQRQRLAITRALAGNPRMLIFDEATSSLDSESELILQNNMQEICRGRTVFIIAHRLSTVRHAHRIITIERGRVVENDRPQRLLEANGRFATLHGIQEVNYA